MTNLDDSTLVAFVDGELDAAEARSVAQCLERDAVAQEKVRLLRTSASLVRAAFAAPEWEEAPPELARLIAHGPRPRGFLARRQFGRLAAVSMAACAAGVAVGIGAERLAAPGPAERLLAEVAEYHTVYAGDDGHLDIAPARAAARIEAWFADVLNRPVRIPDLAQFGMAFAGARLLVADGRPVAQLLYAAPEHPMRPLGVCITAWRSGDRPLTITRRDGVGLALWTRGAYAYVLVGWVDAGHLRQLATALRPVLEAA